jgi:hypothetical protein
MLQRVALSCARCYTSRPPISIRGYAAQPAYVTPVNTSLGGDLSAPSSSVAPIEVAADRPTAREGDAGVPAEKNKRTRAKRTPKDPTAVKEPKPRKKRTPAESKKNTVLAEPLKPIEESATYLNYLGNVKSDEAARDTVFAEVERVRPAQRPRTYHVPSFKNDYAALVKRLNDSFNRDQLYDFCSAHSLRMKEKNKSDLVEAIIEQHWGWPSFEELQMEEKKRTEVVQRGELDVSSSESCPSVTFR